MQRMAVRLGIREMTFTDERRGEMVLWIKNCATPHANAQKLGACFMCVTANLC